MAEPHCQASRISRDFTVRVPLVLVPGKKYAETGGLILYGRSDNNRGFPILEYNFLIPVSGYEYL